MGRQSLRSASQGTLVVPRVRTERYGRRGFSVSGPHVWNLLPSRVCSLAEKPDLFKRELKNYSMQQHSYSTSEVFSLGVLYECSIILLLRHSSSQFSDVLCCVAWLFVALQLLIAKANDIETNIWHWHWQWHQQQYIDFDMMTSTSTSTLTHSYQYWYTL